MKPCSHCGDTKPLTEYYRQSRNKDGRQYVCKICQAEIGRSYRRENPGVGRRSARKSQLRRRYGLTVDAYSALLLEQRGLCRFCARELADDIHVDHDHLTNTVRGLVHGNCNRHFIGSNTIVSSRTLVQYLEETCK